MLSPQFISKHWPLTSVSLGGSFRTSGSRHAIQIHSDQGTYIAKVYEQPASSYDDASRAWFVYDFLSSRKFTHIPALMKTQDGKCFVQSAEQIVAVMEYIDGDPLTPAPETWHSLGKVAWALNEFADYPLEYGVPTNLVIQELTEHARTHFNREKFEAFIDELRPILSYPRRGLIHGEINLANAARRQDGTMILLDWDEAGTGYTILEVGYPLITVFLTEDLHFHCDLASAFFCGYYGGNGPTQDEKQFLFQAALLHALRYVECANRAKRWERICYAAAHKDEIFSAIF